MTEAEEVDEVSIAVDLDSDVHVEIVKKTAKEALAEFIILRDGIKSKEDDK